MQAVEWTYYGSDSSRTTALATYGTKFASDNWMHKSMGIQLGLTESVRCQLPAGTDGTGYWKLTVRALGYEDYTYEFEVTEDNLAVEEKEASAEDLAALQAKVEEAEGLKEADYTAESWANLQTELQESKDLLAKDKPLEAEVKEQITHLTEAIEKLVKADQPVSIDTSSLEKAISDAEGLKESDYTADSWKALQTALQKAKSALEAKESQTAVDEATNILNNAIRGLVKKTPEKTEEKVNGGTGEGTGTGAGTGNTGDGTKTSGTNSVRTGDPASVLGWLGLALGSVGAGVGGVTWKRRKRK